MEQELMNGILEDVPEGTLGGSNGETFTGTDTIASLMPTII